MIPRQTNLPKIIYLLFFILFGYATDAFSNKKITIGVAFRVPYQYSKINQSGLREILGLDIHLLNLIYKQADQEIQYVPIKWSELPEQMQQKKIDLLSGVYKTAKRTKFAYFSQPYRSEVNRLYMRKNDIRYYDHFKTLKRLFASSSMKFLKIGAIQGYNYSDETINQYLNNPRYRNNIVFAKNNTENLNHLLTKKVDLFFDDEIEMERLIGENKLRQKISHLPIPIKRRAVYTMFNKKTMSPEAVKFFDNHMKQLRITGEFQSITRRYVIPMLITIMTETPWYHIAEIAGVIAFCIAGMLLAKNAKLDFFGTLVISALPASAGGIMRDVMLNREPIGILRTPMYLMTVVISVLTGYFLLQCLAILSHFSCFKRLSDYLMSEHSTIKNWFKYFDAFAQSAFIVTGIMVSVETNVTPLWLWGPIFAILSSCGGGIIRDLFLGLGLNRSYLYETAYLWGLFLSIFIIWRTEVIDLNETLLAVFIAMSGIITSRMLLIHHQIHSPNFWHD